MALIKCLECGNEISSKAKVCIHCGFPIEEDDENNGVVKIKLSPVMAITGFNGNQKVSIYSYNSNKLLWEGQSGEIVELYFDDLTEITVKYHLSLMHYGGECRGWIDPNKCKRYNVSARQGIMSTKLVLQKVDVFDAD